MKVTGFPATPPPGPPVGGNPPKGSNTKLASKIPGTNSKCKRKLRALFLSMAKSYAFNSSQTLCLEINCTHMVLNVLRRHVQGNPTKTISKRTQIFFMSKHTPNKSESLAKALYKLALLRCSRSVEYAVCLLNYANRRNVEMSPLQRLWHVWH